MIELRKSSQIEGPSKVSTLSKSSWNTRFHLTAIQLKRLHHVAQSQNSHWIHHQGECWFVWELSYWKLLTSTRCSFYDRHFRILERISVDNRNHLHAISGTLMFVIEESYRERCVTWLTEPRIPFIKAFGRIVNLLYHSHLKMEQRTLLPIGQCYSNECKHVPAIL